MASHAETSDRARAVDKHTQEVDFRQLQMEIARRIAQESLEADHHALELDAKLAFRANGRA